MLTLPSVLTHAVVPDFVRTLGPAMQSLRAELVVDASALQQFDSSALALLLECRRQALAAGQGFSVRNAPALLRQLAGLYGVAELIPAASNSPA